MVVFALLAVAVLVAYLLVQRTRELFCVSVRKGRALVVRGRIPQGLLNDLTDVLAKPPVQSASIRAVRTASGARLTVDGVDEGQEQRLRNVFHIYPLARLSAAPLLDRRSLGQWLGIAWLAWLLDRSVGPRNP
ncbi:MAG: DUF3634 family protein [Deltaproteobacteria bacterium]|nr:DUF3634 family protein [Deltaproteobacteria bacterium]